MGIKVGITGHTRGFGKHLTKHCIAAGYNVQGFSKTNGYDLQTDWLNIFLSDLDIIINNAEVDSVQLYISIFAYKHNIKCINIGSKITEAEVFGKDITKKFNKIALKECSRSFNQPYLTWGFTAGNSILDNNPELLETITIEDAVKEVLNELALS